MMKEKQQQMSKVFTLRRRGMMERQQTATRRDGAAADGKEA